MTNLIIDLPPSQYYTPRPWPGIIALAIWAAILATVATVRPTLAAVRIALNVARVTARVTFDDLAYHLAGVFIEQSIGRVSYA
jgi:hypothetical protein